MLAAIRLKIRVFVFFQITGKQKLNLTYSLEEFGSYTTLETVKRIARLRPTWLGS
jgi:hypothetical protein